MQQKFPFFRSNYLASELQKRILVLDGAMGTMVQKYSLTEKDFRGQIFLNHMSDLKGNNDVLSVTKPEVISEIHEVFFLSIFCRKSFVFGKSKQKNSYT